MGKYRDLTGQKFGRLTVVEYAGRDKSNHSLWLCRCDCGEQKVIRGHDLGRTKSCGCYQREQARKAHLVDLTGRRFGRLTCLEIAGQTKNKNMLWLCQCDCGKLTIVSQGNLTYGNVKSCGCLNVDRTKEVNTKHGLTHTRLYNIWRGIRKRCFDPTVPEYQNYGGRGISVCQEWLEFINFANWAKANGYKDGLTIERINNDGNYEPTNCRWIPLAEQARNRRNSHFVSYSGETKTLAEWSNITGINPDTISARLKRYGWPVEKALTQPVRGRNHENANAQQTLAF